MIKHGVALSHHSELLGLSICSCHADCYRHNRQQLKDPDTSTPALLHGTMNESHANQVVSFKSLNPAPPCWLTVLQGQHYLSS